MEFYAIEYVSLLFFFIFLNDDGVLRNHFFVIKVQKCLVSFVKLCKSCERKRSKSDAIIIN